ncbi:MAG: hypothetical protein ACRD4L_14330 [Pyrinomonadaceae bacterium]
MRSVNSFRVIRRISQKLFERSKIALKAHEEGNQTCNVWYQASCFRALFVFRGERKKARNKRVMI